MSLTSFLTFLLIGAVAGWLTGLITKGRGFGLAGNIIVGVIGAFLANFVFGLLGIGAYSLVGRLIFALLGSMGFVWLLRFIKK